MEQYIKVTKKSMKKILAKFFRYSWLLRNTPKIIWFNFHYLPFKQAIKLPIWLRKENVVEKQSLNQIVSKQE